MNNYILKPDFEPQNRYENALKALLEADKAIEPLTDMEKQSLLQDYIKYKITGMFAVLKTFFIKLNIYISYLLLFHS